MLKGGDELSAFSSKLKRKENIFFEIVSQSIEFHNAFVSYKNNEYHLNREINQEKYSVYSLMFIENYLNTFTRYRLTNLEEILNIQEYITKFVPGSVCKLVQKMFTH